MYLRCSVRAPPCFGTTTQTCLCDSAKEEAKAKKAASEEAAKPSKGADEAAAIRTAKASSLEPQRPQRSRNLRRETPILSVPCLESPPLLGPVFRMPTTKKDEWVIKPSGNVLIRVHHQPRTKLFTRKDVGDCPASVCRITPGRTTRVVSQQDGSKEDFSDGSAGRFSAQRELPVLWTGIIYSDSEHSAAALSAAGLSPHEGNIPVSSGAAVTVSTASSITLAETTKEKPSVFGSPCQLEGGDERPPFTVGNSVLASAERVMLLAR